MAEQERRYSDSLVALAAIWRVLQRHASPKRPLSVNQILGYLPSEYSTSPDGVLPSRSTIDKWLQRIAASGLDTFPFQLRCMARASAPLGEGEDKYIPYYEEYYDKLDDKSLDNNNRARYYYLEPALTHEECQILDRLVRSSPGIPRARAQVLLGYLSRLDRQISTYLGDTCENDRMAEKGVSLKPITFGEIRKYCSKIDRVSICRLETLMYENYDCVELVPHDRDGLYLYGFGMIESEFTGPQGRIFAPCMEFMLSEKPREAQT